MTLENNPQPAGKVCGYKVFNPDFTCRGYQFAEGAEFIHQGEIGLCDAGFHFCRNAVDCFNYYSFDSDNIVCEVETLGNVEHGEDKSVTDHLHIVKRLQWSDVLAIVNTGKNNSGHSNSGDSNSGDRNSGHRNSGDWNSGHSNSGDWNSGHSNSGDWNSGDWNSGHWNSGHSNSGHRNSGHRNSGHSNSGDRNSGHSNSGDWNSTRYSSGVFNTQESKILMFNKPSDWTYSDWRNSDAYGILSNLVLEEWVWFDSMSDEEKKAEPKAFVRDGYLKHYPYKHACMTLWADLNDEQKLTVQALPNFDKEVFFEITGVQM